MGDSRKTWLIPYGVQLIPTGALFFGSLWIKESPRWLLSKGKRLEALENLHWIRMLTAEDVYIQEEVALLDAAIDQQNALVESGFWGPFKAAANNRKVQWR